MSETMITCPMCGFRYDPAAHLGCQTCPLHRACQMVCCPSCGYQTVDAGKSVLARIAERLLFNRSQASPKNESLQVSHHDNKNNGGQTDGIIRS